MSAAATQLDQLRRWTVVVADTGDFESMRAFQPRDATTNPSLILAAASKPQYAALVDRVIADRGDSDPRGAARVEDVVDRLLVAFGLEILQIVPGRVSTETDARLSFDVDGTIAKARRLIELYERQGVDRERVLIKIASTWEGLCAARQLEREGIHCNLTLLFSLPQAAVAAEVGATLISPFVGRILDWHQATHGRDFAPVEDPGVQSVREIYAYFKKFGYATEVMGASFRNKGEILELAGCDLLTISPSLLGELAESTDPIERKLDPDASGTADTERLALDEKTFRYRLNDDAMATEKTAEGIRRFAADMIKLEELVAGRL